MSFSDLGLSEKTLKAIDELGYTEPTPIQKQAIPQILKRNDVIGIAQTGTGKTASFTLPMIDILAAGRAKALMPRTLILSPTRELATQISDCFQKYGKYHKLNMALLIGGESMIEQQKILSRGVDVLIATPGRMLDLCERGKILLRDVQVWVLDEADRMLDMGFIPDIEKIALKLPEMRQTLLFSATMPPEIKALAKKFMSYPVEVWVDSVASAATTVAQFMVKTNDKGKREVLRSLIRAENVQNAMIFCNRKKDVDILYKSLSKHNFSVVALHGDMAQSMRTDTLNEFRDGKIQLMVCSDVAARGLDLPEVSQVFNFDVPINAEDYIHRIGRTGRAGKTGRSFVLVTTRDLKYFDAIEKLLGKKIEEMPRFSTQMDASKEKTKKPAPKTKAVAVPKTVAPKPEKPVKPAKQEKKVRLPKPSASETAVNVSQAAVNLGQKAFAGLMPAFMMNQINIEESDDDQS